MILTLSKCPHCDGTSFAVEVKTWVNVEAAEDNDDDSPHFEFASFNDEDGDYAEPVAGGDIICRDCEYVLSEEARSTPIELNEPEQAAAGPAQIVITVSGGVVQDVAGVPPGIRVAVHDYDNGEDVDPDDLPDDCFEDQHGQIYQRAVYE